MSSPRDREPDGSGWHEPEHLGGGEPTGAEGDPAQPAETWQPAIPGSCSATHSDAESRSAVASDHAAILRAVEGGDGRSAEDLMREHLERCQPVPGDRPG